MPPLAAPAAAKWVIDAVDLLAANRSHEPRLALSRHVTAVRIGRNDVWEIVAPSLARERYYAKFWTSRTLFQRELRGREIVNTIAASHRWLMPAPLLFADARVGAIVTEQLPGAHFDALLRSALRHFTPLTRRRDPCADPFKCLELVLRFLQELHRHPLESNHPFADIRPAAVVGRVNQLAQGLREVPSVFRSVQELRWFPIELPDIPSSAEPDVLLYGDLSPANFLFDGERIGLFDFENMGVGPACRDYVRLQFHLESIGAQWRCRATDSFVELVPRTGSGELHLLFRLHFALLHVNLALGRGRSRALHRRVMDIVELRRATKQLRKCCLEIRSAGWFG